MTADSVSMVYEALTVGAVWLLSTGLLAWLVLHRGWYEWLGVERPES